MRWPLTLPWQPVMWESDALQVTANLGRGELPGVRLPAPLLMGGKGRLDSLHIAAVEFAHQRRAHGGRSAFGLW